MENRVWNSLAVCALVVAFALSDSAATATNQSVTTQAPGENPEHTVAPTVNVTTPPPAPENLKTAPENPKTAPVTNDTVSNYDALIRNCTIINFFFFCRFVVSSFLIAFYRVKLIVFVTYNNHGTGPPPRPVVRWL